MQKYVIILSFFLISFVACQSATSGAEVESGERLASKYCISCHHPTAGENSRMAPPLVQVRDTYLAIYPEREDFVQAMTDFVNHPTAEKALMPAAVKKYGLMPRLSYSKERLEAIAVYMLETELAAPDWYVKE
jgi:mono/diheme cytochrome c family protein